MSFSKVQYITSGLHPEDHYTHTRRALDQGINWIQLRIKNDSDLTITRIAERIQRMKESYDFTFIINDHPDLVKTIDADGVHLGLEDMSVFEARKLLGTKKIIGGTANSLADVLQRQNEQCDYIGLGPLRQTSTKEKLSPILGYAGYANLMSQLQDQQQLPPIYAIGGITAEDIVPLADLGIYGVALSRFLQENFDKPATIKQIISTR